jgi:hypothetical protein
MHEVARLCCILCKETESGVVAKRMRFVEWKGGGGVSLEVESLEVEAAT